MERLLICFLLCYHLGEAAIEATASTKGRCTMFAFLTLEKKVVRVQKYLSLQHISGLFSLSQQPISHDNFSNTALKFLAPPSIFPLSTLEPFFAYKWKERTLCAAEFKGTLDTKWNLMSKKPFKKSNLLQKARNCREPFLELIDPQWNSTS